MNNWLFDLGNTRLKFAALPVEGAPVLVDAVAHDGRGLVPGWEDRLPAVIDRAFVASVGPADVLAAVQAALGLRGATVSVAAPAARLLGITAAYGEPSRLGIDRLLAMAAAHARDPAPSVVAGIGTAMTIDLVDAEGRHRGGRIAPSPALMREALARRAPGLPGHGGQYAEFGVDTASALASGCAGAALALIERSREQGQAMLGRAPRLWVHGGGAAELLPWLQGASHAPSLVLEGLAMWARRSGRAD